MSLIPRESGRAAGAGPELRHPRAKETRRRKQTAFERRKRTTIENDARKVKRLSVQVYKRTKRDATLGIGMRK